ncbi:MAG: hypothetical protein IPN76_11050 [Saprospiraceae bacterium]|nr:hypothetical protein [Saprospiraceae bacterium]
MKLRTSNTVFQAFIFAFLSANLFFVTAIPAQDIWSLQRCIEYARTNSIALKQAENGIQLAALNDKQNQLSRLPSATPTPISAISLAEPLTRFPTDLKSQTIAFNSMGLNAGATRVRWRTSTIPSNRAKST